MEQYNVTGMSCAACSARVEKAVKKVPGVTSCSVSLLTNSMGVEGTASPAAILSAVQEAGYGASPKNVSASKASGAAPTSTHWLTTRHRAQAPPHRLAGLPAGADVLLHGPHDVGLALPHLVRWQPRRTGPCPSCCWRASSWSSTRSSSSTASRASSTAHPTWIRWWPSAPWQALCGAPTPSSPDPRPGGRQQ